MDSPPALPLDPRRLETFRRVALAGTVTEAARQLALSQPAVTAQVRGLEAELGRALFRRGRDGMRLTPEGEALLEVAQRMAALLAEAVQRVAVAPRLGRLEVGASTTAAAYLLPPLLGRFLRQHPGVPVRVGSGNTAEMLEAVRRGDLPLALVEGLPRAAGLMLEPYVTDELVLVGPPDLAGDAPRCMADLGARQILWREPGSGTRAVVARALGKARLPQSGDLELGHTEAIKTAILCGLGLGFLSRLSIAREVAAGLLRELPLADVHIPRTFTWVHGAGALAPSASALLRLARQP